jgi:hypothetical protein
MKAMTHIDTPKPTMHGPRYIGVLAWVLLGLGAVACDCGSSGDSDAVLDGMVAPGDAETATDADGDLVPSGECMPAGSPSSLSCPEGCAEWTVRLVDVSMECTTSEEVVGACFPEDADIFGTLEAACFTHPDMEGTVIWSPSSVVGVTGGSDDILEDAGWIRCSETTKLRYEEPCE